MIVEPSYKYATNSDHCCHVIYYYHYNICMHILHFSSWRRTFVNQYHLYLFASSLYVTFVKRNGICISSLKFSLNTVCLTHYSTKNSRCMPPIHCLFTVWKIQSDEKAESIQHLLTEAGHSLWTLESSPYIKSWVSHLFRVYWFKTYEKSVMFFER